MSEKKQLIELIAATFGMAITVQNPTVSDEEIQRMLDRSQTIAETIKPKLLSLFPEEKEVTTEERYASLGWYKPSEKRPDEYRMVAVILSEDPHASVFPALYKDGNFQLLNDVPMTHAVYYWCELPQNPYFG